jgi:hypothetical protein
MTAMRGFADPTLSAISCRWEFFSKPAAQPRPFSIAAIESAAPYFLA